MRSRVQAIFGILLVGAGVLFLLDLAEMVDAWGVIGSYWPAIFILFGVIAIMNNPASFVSGGILIAIGAILLIATLDILDVSVWQLLIPLVLIAIGFGLVLRGWRPEGTPSSDVRTNLMAILGDQHIRSQASGFERGTLTSILGEVQFDLRGATLKSDGATIDAFSALGDVDILVPRGWKIDLQGMPILGDFEDNTDPSAEIPPDAPTLVITGTAILGDVEVKHS